MIGAQRLEVPARPGQQLHGLAQRLLPHRIQADDGEQGIDGPVDVAGLAAALRQHRPRAGRPVAQRAPLGLEPAVERLLAGGESVEKVAAMTDAVKNGVIAAHAPRARADP